MNEEELNRLLERWAGIFVQEIRNALESSQYNYAPGFKLNAYAEGRNSKYSGVGNKIFSRSLYNSVEAVVSGSEFELYMNNYWRYVNDGVPAKPQYLEGKGGGGTSKFIEALLPWVSQKLGVSGPQALGAALAVRRNIWKFGIAPSNFYTIAVDNMIVKLEQEFGDQYFDILEQIIVNRTIRDIIVE